MKLLFSAKPEIDDDDVVLRRAVRQTCHELLDIHHLDKKSFSTVEAVVIRSIIKIFDNGVRNPMLLAQIATARALEKLGRRYH